MWGWGIPSVHKRAATPIPAQTTRGTRVEEPQGEHGVEVRVRECMRHVNVSKVSHLRHETHHCYRRKSGNGELKAKPEDEAQVTETDFFSRRWWLEGDQDVSFSFCCKDFE